ncbi:hypothetical protein [Sporosarcina sp. FA9]|uniref:hypothetical protein n=1 Tax=Sporosarcina sp. FA9 TaxID=3413030 RepID=UPI003F65C8A7
MKAKLVLITVFAFSLCLITGCANEKMIIENTTTEQSLPKFDLINNEFPPTLNGFVTINDTRYDMASGGYQWSIGNQTVTTDHAGPTQMAEHFTAIMAKPNSVATIQIPQNPNLNAYLWNPNDTRVHLEDNQITIPDAPGRYIYEVRAEWSNGNMSFTFVVEVE